MAAGDKSGDCDDILEDIDKEVDRIDRAEKILLEASGVECICDAPEWVLREIDKMRRKRDKIESDLIQIAHRCGMGMEEPIEHKHKIDTRKFVLPKEIVLRSDRWGQKRGRNEYKY